MLAYFYKALYLFRRVFSHHSTWLVFCMIIIGFVGYKTFLHFFRYSTWSLELLVCQWTTFVLAQHETVIIHGRAVLTGDHTYVPKDGRMMPGVVTIHQNLRNPIKASIFSRSLLGCY